MTCRSRRRSESCATRSRGWSARTNISAPRKLAQKIARAMPDAIHDWARKVEEYTRGWVTGGTLFEELGFYYVGPVDGHDVRALVEVLENVRDAEIGPMLVHVVTKKGKGYAPAENCRRQISWRGQVRRRLGRAGQGRGRARRATPASIAKALARRDGARRQGRRDHRGDAVGHRARQGRRATFPSARSTSASPSSMR